MLYNNLIKQKKIFMKFDKNIRKMESTSERKKILMDSLYLIQEILRIEKHH